MTDRGIIYMITCNETGKSYIGQTSYRGTDHGREVDGLQKRWKKHRQSACVNGSPIEQALYRHGPTAFTVQELVNVPLHLVDEMEAKLIEAYNTLVPNGYNVASFRREKNRGGTTVQQQFIDHTHLVLVKLINRGGNPNHIRVEMHTEDGIRRSEFGTKGGILPEAVPEGLRFAEAFKGRCEIRIDERLWQYADKEDYDFDVVQEDDLDANGEKIFLPVRYQKKLEELLPASLVKVYFEKCTGHIAVKVTPEGCKSWKNKRCFKFAGSNSKYAVVFAKRIPLAGNGKLEIDQSAYDGRNN